MKKTHKHYKRLMAKCHTLFAKADHAECLKLCLKAHEYFPRQQAPLVLLSLLFENNNEMLVKILVKLLKFRKNDFDHIKKIYLASDDCNLKLKMLKKMQRLKNERWIIEDKIKLYQLLNDVENTTYSLFELTKFDGFVYDLRQYLRSASGFIIKRVLNLVGKLLVQNEGDVGYVNMFLEMSHELNMHKQYVRVFEKYCYEYFFHKKFFISKDSDKNIQDGIAIQEIENASDLNGNWVTLKAKVDESNAEVSVKENYALPNGEKNDSYGSNGSYFTLRLLLMYWVAKFSDIKRKIDEKFTETESLVSSVESDLVNYFIENRIISTDILFNMDLFCRILEAEVAHWKCFETIFELVFAKQIHLVTNDDIRSLKTTHDLKLRWIVMLSKYFLQSDLEKSYEILKTENEIESCALLRHNICEILVKMGRVEESKQYEEEQLPTELASAHEVRCKFMDAISVLDGFDNQLENLNHRNTPFNSFNDLANLTTPKKVDLQTQNMINFIDSCDDHSVGKPPDGTTCLNSNGQNTSLPQLMQENLSQAPIEVSNQPNLQAAFENEIHSYVHDCQGSTETPKKSDRTCDGMRNLHSILTENPNYSHAISQDDSMQNIMIEDQMKYVCEDFDRDKSECRIQDGTITNKANLDFDEREFLDTNSNALCEKERLHSIESSKIHSVFEETAYENPLSNLLQTDQTDFESCNHILKSLSKPIDFNKPVFQAQDISKISVLKYNLGSNHNFTPNQLHILHKFVSRSKKLLKNFFSNKILFPNITAQFPKYKSFCDAENLTKKEIRKINYIYRNFNGLHLKDWFMLIKLYITALIAMGHHQKAMQIINLTLLASYNSVRCLTPFRKYFLGLAGVGLKHSLINDDHRSFFDIIRRLTNNYFSVCAFFSRYFDDFLAGRPYNDASRNVVRFILRHRFDEKLILNYLFGTQSTTFEIIDSKNTELDEECAEYPNHEKTELSLKSICSNSIEEHHGGSVQIVTDESLNISNEQNSAEIGSQANKNSHNPLLQTSESLFSQEESVKLYNCSDKSRKSLSKKNQDTYSYVLSDSEIFKIVNENFAKCGSTVRSIFLGAHFPRIIHNITTDFLVSTRCEYEYTDGSLAAILLLIRSVSKKTADHEKFANLAFETFHNVVSKCEATYIQVLRKIGQAIGQVASNGFLSPCDPLTYPESENPDPLALNDTSNAKSAKNIDTSDFGKTTQNHKENLTYLEYLKHFDHDSKKAKADKNNRKCIQLKQKNLSDPLAPLDYESDSNDAQIDDTDLTAKNLSKIRNLIMGTPSAYVIDDFSIRIELEDAFEELMSAYYNLGRAYHVFGFRGVAEEFYKRSMLSETLRHYAVYNLSLIYIKSKSRALYFDLIEKYRSGCKNI